VRRLQRTARNFLDIAHAPTVRARVPRLAAFPT
jgi:hypothetical protein